MKRLLGLSMIVLAGIVVSSSVPAQEKKLEIIPVKYEGLKQEILKHRGKVVLVDFWATNCLPCVAALPHYVELQKKHGDKGLVVIAVSVDNMKKLDRANTILKENLVSFTSFLLDEPDEVWHKKFEFTGLPFAYVFDRRGKWVRFRSVDFANAPDGTYGQEVDKTVLQMLSEK